MTGRVGRPRKVGQRRADAALDAMRPYGFREPSISRKLKELLDVYGEDGWPFIEEGSYRVLLDALLEEGQEMEQNKGLDAAEPNEPDKAEASMASVVTSTPTLSLVPSTSTASISLDTARQMGEAAESITKICDTGEKSMLEEISLHQHDDGREKSRVVDHGLVRCDCDLSKHNRRPYYGWINNEEVREEDLIELAPEPLPRETKRLLCGVGSWRGRESKWDLRPEDMAKR